MDFDHDGARPGEHRQEEDRCHSKFLLHAFCMGGHSK